MTEYVLKGSEVMVAFLDGMNIIIEVTREMETLACPLGTKGKVIAISPCANQQILLLYITPIEPEAKDTGYYNPPSMGRQTASPLDVSLISLVKILNRLELASWKPRKRFVASCKIEKMVKAVDNLPEYVHTAFTMDIFYY